MIIRVVKAVQVEDGDNKEIFLGILNHDNVGPNDTPIHDVYRVTDMVHVGEDLTMEELPSELHDLVTNALS